MYMSLFVLGITATTAGIAMVGFGIPINEFSLGNTLLIAGTTAIVGGLILIGLAAAVKQLRRIAEALVARPAPRATRPLDPSDPVTPGNFRAAPGPGRIPFPPKPNSETRGPAPLEPRLAAAPSIDASKEGAFERPRVPFPSMADTPEPRAGQGHHEPSWSPRAQHAVPEVRLGLTDIAVETGGLEITTERLSISRLDIASQPAPPSETAGQSQLFDSLWPTEARSGKAPIPEIEPKLETSSLQAEGRKQDKTSAEPHVVSILKSGVIDEMAYTLYSDGSIEAELPQGTVRFGSIAELRGYLEKSSS